MLNQHIFVVLLRELFDSGGMFLASLCRTPSLLEVGFDWELGGGNRRPTLPILEGKTGTRASLKLSIPRLTRLLL